MGPVQMAAAVFALAGLLAVSGCGEKGAANNATASPAGRPSEAQERRSVDALLRAEQTMARMDDLTYRGTWEAPEGPDPFAGREVTTTLRVTADGRCEQVHETADGVRVTGRNIHGTMWMNRSDEYLTHMPPEYQEDSGLWGADDADPPEACDITSLSESLDLDTVEQVGRATVAGRVEYVATSAHPQPGSNGVVRFWITRGNNPLIGRIAGQFGWLHGSADLVSTNDGLKIPEPPRKLWVTY